MKKWTLFFSIIISLFSFAQEGAKGTKPGSFTGGFGLSYIDGAPNYAFRMQPEFAFSNFGIGLDLNLEFEASGKLRTENFNTASDYLAIIRYIRYGVKHDPVYAQIGAIDHYTLGHGSIMFQYNNSPSFDDRKIGALLDLNFDKWGVETIYADFSQGSVMAARGYFKPLQFTEINNIPIISNLEVGASFAGDMHSKAGVDSGRINLPKNDFTVLRDNGAINIYGFDIGFPLWKTSFTGAQLYLDYAKIANFGNGVSSGIIFNFNGMGLLSASVKFERQWNSSKYLPSYFGSLYEIERFSASLSGSSTDVKSKVKELGAITTAERGYFGSLGIDVLKLVNLYGSYSRLDNVASSGTLTLQAEVAPKNLPFLARAGYDKTNIAKESELFTLDDRSFLYAELGYKPYSYLLVSMIYQWTYTPIRDNNKNIIGFETQKKVEPRVSIVIPFG